MVDKGLKLLLVQSCWFFLEKGAQRLSDRGDTDFAAGWKSSSEALTTLSLATVVAVTMFGVGLLTHRFETNSQPSEKA